MERRVAERADDLLVGLPRLGGVQQLGLNRFAVDPHRELGDGGALRYRKEVDTLGDPVVRVPVDLVDARLGDPVADGDVDAVGADLDLVTKQDRLGGRLDRRSGGP
jgi:hypothetical protein